LINQAGVGSAVAQIPTVPVGITLTTGGPDPYLYLSPIQGSAGQTVTETLYLDVTNPDGIQLTALDEAIGFDANAVQISDVRSAAGLAGIGSYTTMSNVDNGSGVLLVGQAFMGSGLPPLVPYGTIIPVLEFNVTLTGSTPVGSTTDLTLLQDGTINGQTKYTAISDNEGALTWTPGKAPSNDGNPAVDGTVTVVADTTPAGEIVASTPKSSVAPTLVTPVRRANPLKVANSSAPPPPVLSTDVTVSSEFVVTANTTEEVVATTVSPLSFPLAPTAVEASVATMPSAVSPRLASDVVETVSLMSSVARAADAGASLSVAVFSTNKVGAVTSPESSSVKNSTGVLDEMYRQLGAALAGPPRYDYYLGVNGGEASDAADNMWVLEDYLIDQD
jgi:hypothetical protein